MSDNLRRTITGLSIVAVIVAFLSFVTVLRDYNISFNNGITLTAKISIPRASNVIARSTEPRKVSLSTSSRGTAVDGYEFQISRFHNMMFPHSYRTTSTSKVVAELTGGATYYTRVRCYKKNKMGRVVFGKWSAVSRVTAKNE